MRALTIGFFMLSSICYTFIGIDSCNSYVLSWLGYMPVILVRAVLCWLGQHDRGAACGQPLRSCGLMCTLSLLLRCTAQRQPPPAPHLPCRCSA